MQQKQAPVAAWRYHIEAYGMCQLLMTALVCSAEAQLQPYLPATQEAIGVLRWRSGMTFGQFAELTVKDYYPDARQTSDKENMCETAQ
jgi:hypothetical protein